ncbi:MAG: DNA-directed RNA polymerase subunit alpha [candidate division WS2 bacterium]|nr:DNA-directed RNA polymerase subunit alpha [Candidatus Lithacetigena glycinireducens]MBT9174404.1 DNA-directed RNA polymerase subunit alpha [Candidatus Lithacetigena glycinireducens]
MISFTEGVEVIKDALTSDYLRLIVTPLYKGYGTTIGNALRRVLLSSIEGSKIIGFRMSNLPHEFTYVNGIKEDGPRIALNIRNLVVNLIGDYSIENPKSYVIRKVGPGFVSGSDIVEGEIMVVNPEQVFLTMERDVEVEMELFLAKGVGYMPSQVSKEAFSYPLNSIALDSYFSPVVKVNYQVEPTRVGREIDYDKLTLEIWTNKAISPWDAFTRAISILKSHLNIMEKPIEKVKDEKLELISIQSLNLKKRVENILLREGLSSVDKITIMSRNDFIEIDGFGEKALEELEKKLHDIGMSLKEDINET